jgi:hypothetical protein
MAPTSSRMRRTPEVLEFDHVMGFDKTRKSRKKAKRQVKKKESDQKLFKRKHDAKKAKVNSKQKSKKSK